MLLEKCLALNAELWAGHGQDRSAFFRSNLTVRHTEDAPECQIRKTSCGVPSGRMTAAFIKREVGDIAARTVRWTLAMLDHLLLVAVRKTWRGSRAVRNSLAWPAKASRAPVFRSLFVPESSRPSLTVLRALAVVCPRSVVRKGWRATFHSPSVHQRTPAGSPTPTHPRMYHWKT